MALKEIYRIDAKENKVIQQKAKELLELVAASKPDIRLAKHISRLDEAIKRV